MHVCSLLPPLLRSSAAAVARDAAAEAYMVQPAIAAVAEEADLTRKVFRCKAAPFACLMIPN